jgi:hypothetical protein
VRLERSLQVVEIAVRTSLSRVRCEMTGSRCEMTGSRCQMIQPQHHLCMIRPPTAPLCSTEQSNMLQKPSNSCMVGGFLEDNKHSIPAHTQPRNDSDALYTWTPIAGAATYRTFARLGICTVPGSAPWSCSAAAGYPHGATPMNALVIGGNGC